MPVFRLFLLACLFHVVGLSSAQTTYEPGRALDRDSVVNDIRFLADALTTFHPGLYRYQTPPEWEAAVDQTAQALSDEPTEAEVQRLLAELLARIRCGHTYLNPWNARKELRDRLYDQRIYLPVLFRVLGDQLVVTHDLHGSGDIAPGTLIAAINGVAAGDILARLVPLVKGDGRGADPFRRHTLSLDDIGERGHEWFDMYFPLYFPLEGDQFRLTLLDARGENEREVRVSAFTKQERVERYRERVGEEARTWPFRLLDGEVGYLHVSSFAIWNWDFDLEAHLDTAFRFFARSGADQLVVDLRGNGGGLTEAADKLLSYLSVDTIRRGPESVSTTVFNEMPARFQSHLETYEPWLKGPIGEDVLEPLPDGRFRVKVGGGRAAIPPRDDAFRGEVVLLVDGSNASAAFYFARRFKDNQLGAVVGMPTGGNRCGINGSQYFFAYLPYSGFEIDIPLVNARPVGEQPDAGLWPDVRVPETAADIAAGRDVQLTAALRLLRDR